MRAARAVEGTGDSGEGISYKSAGNVREVKAYRPRFLHRLWQRLSLLLLFACPS